MKHRFLFLLLFAAAGVCVAQPNKYVISAWWEPPLGTDSLSGYRNYSAYKSLGFNTVVGIRSDYPAPSAPYTLAANRQIVRNAAANGLWVILQDTCFCNSIYRFPQYIPGQSYTISPTDQSNALAYINNFTNDVYNRYLGPSSPMNSAQKSAIIGWIINGELQGEYTGQWLERARLWINNLNAKDPTRFVSVMLGGNSNDFSVNNVKTFYSEPNASPIVMFDKYTFHSVSPMSMPFPGTWPSDTTAYRQNHFDFYARENFAELQRDHNKTLWTFPLSIEHVVNSNDDQGNPWVTHYYRRNEQTLRYEVSLGLIYGSKGQFYYTYSEPTSDPLTGRWISMPYQTNHWYGEFYNLSPSILNDDGTTIAPGLKQWVPAINSELTSLGPTLMNLQWVATINGKDTNNYLGYKEWLEDGNDLSPFEKPAETGLYDPSDNACRFINNVAEIRGSTTIPNTKGFAAGWFTNKADNYEYVIYMNKNIGNQNYLVGTPTVKFPNTFKIQFGEGSVYDLQLLTNKTSVTWTPQTPSNVITVTVNAGDYGMLRLRRSHILKIYNPAIKY